MKFIPLIVIVCGLVATWSVRGYQVDQLSTETLELKQKDKDIDARIEGLLIATERNATTIELILPRLEK